MRILVSGGAGFIGSHTVELLSDHGHSVCVIDNLSTGRVDNLDQSFCDLFDADIRDELKLAWIFKEFKPEAILHLAAQSAISTAWENPKKDLRVNGAGTLNMLAMAREYEVERFVFSSTSAVYRPYRYIPFGMSENNTFCYPETPYGISKFAAENYIRAMFPNYLILRYGNVYGPRQVPIGENQIISHIFRHFYHGDDFELTYNGKQTRDFVFVKDIAMANMMALTSPVIGTFNAASGVSTSINELLESFEVMYGIEGYKWERSDIDDPRGSVKVNVNKIWKELHWKAQIGIAEGLKATADWWEKK